MLLGSALVGFCSDAFAQAQRGGSRSSSGSSRSTSVQRPSSNNSSQKSSAVRPSGQTSKPSGTVARPSGQQNRPSGSTATRPSGGTNAKPSSGSVTRPADRPASKPSTGNVNRPMGESRPGVRPNDRPQNAPSHTRPSGNVGVRPNNPPRPVGVKTPHRPPVYVYPTYVTRSYYGPRPPRPRPGVTIRPYYGTVIAHNIAANMAWTAVRLAYYSSVARTYSLIADNNAYIAEQNAVIAQNNAIIAAQNQTIAQSDMLAQAAYDKAKRLGLVQSYAAADMEYYYQNGVFYVLDVDGEYRVIIPPAGAIVDSLPSDRNTVTLGGEVFYQVDDTIYQSRNIDGNLYFEVLGQLYK